MTTDDVVLLGVGALIESLRPAAESNPDTPEFHALEAERVAIEDAARSACRCNVCNSLRAAGRPPLHWKDRTNDNV